MLEHIEREAAMKELMNDAPEAEWCGYCDDFHCFRANN